MSASPPASDATRAAPEPLTLRELYERYGHAVYRRCQYFLRHDADARDAMHDVFLKLAAGYSTFHGDCSPLTWVVRVTTNHCLNVLRARRARWPQRYEASVHVGRATRASEASQLERQQLVRDVLGHVSRQAQEAAIYYFVDEMTQEEAAAAAGCSVPTLRKRLREFIRAARQALTHIDADVVFGPEPV